MAVSSRRVGRLRRHRRVRKRVQGTPERPRLNIFRSSKHIYAQVIDDSSGRTLVSASTLDPTIRDELNGLKKVEQAKLVGQIVGQRAAEVGIDTVVFDRGGYKYHGRVRALADGAREAGLDF